MLAKKFIGQLAIPRDSAGFDQSDPFPGFAETGVIVFHAFARTGEGPGPAFGPQSKINAEKSALRVRRGKRFENSFSEAVKPLMIRNARRHLALVAVKKDKIDIGAMVQLAAA